MKTPVRRPRKTSRRVRRGQAMVEYSYINYVLAMGLMLGLTINFGSGEQKVNIIHAFMRAYQVYYDSFYFVLNLPFP
ncbi:hypothetical protein I3V78_18790 [Archangium primigenium]|nr:hypothetical protein [Archangium primigenium]